MINRFDTVLVTSPRCFSFAKAEVIDFGKDYPILVKMLDEFSYDKYIFRPGEIIGFDLMGQCLGLPRYGDTILPIKSIKLKTTDA